MKFLMGLVAAVATMALAAGAQAATWTITGGSFFMAGVSPAVTALTGTSLIEGSYQAKGTIFDPFIFFGQPVQTYTDAANQGDTNTPAGTIAGGPAPSINVAAGTADLSSFFADWNGTDFNQGTATATYVGDATGGTLSWSSLIIGGPFNGFTGDWTMDVVAVPEPMSMALVGSSIIGLIALRRRMA